MEAVIIDAVVLCILLGFVIYGAYRGLFRALAGLLIVVLALVGAGLAAKTLTPAAVNLLTPVIEKGITQRVDKAFAVQTEQGKMPEAGRDIGQAEELLGLLGMDSQTIGSLAQRAEEKIKETGVSLVTAVVESMMYSILYGILFLLSFLTLLVALRLLARAMDLVLKLPGLSTLNRVGGGAAGLLEGGLVLFLAVWAARRFGFSFETELLASTHILRFFTTNTPLGVLSFLR